MCLSDFRRFALLSTRVPVLRHRIKRAYVLVERTNEKINLNRVSCLHWLSRSAFLLSLSVFLLLRVWDTPSLRAR